MCVCVCVCSLNKLIFYIVRLSVKKDCISYSAVYSPSWKDCSLLYGQGISRILQNMKIHYRFIYLFYHVATAAVFQGHLIIKDSWTHSDIPHSVGVLWASYQPEAETSTWHHTTLTRDKHPCSRQDSNPQSQQAKRPQTHAVDRAATGTDICFIYETKICIHNIYKFKLLLLLRSRVWKFPAWHTKTAPNGNCCEGYIVPSMVRLMYQLKSVLK